MNVRGAMPQRHQAKAQPLLCAMPSADTRRTCEALRDQFDTRDRHLAPNAVERLGNDWERLLTCSPFPREHWRHLHTTKVVEFPVAAVRLRTTAATWFKKVDAATALMWKVLQVAETSFRRLQTPELLPAVYAGATYANGIRQTAVSQPEAAA